MYEMKKKKTAFFFLVVIPYVVLFVACFPFQSFTDPTCTLAPYKTDLADERLSQSLQSFAKTEHGVLAETGINFQERQYFVSLSNV